jgi:hypothetical protein
VATDEDVLEALTCYERVEWHYDGLNGKIIPWTKENGGTSDDPSVQAFVVHVDGSVIARAPDRAVHQSAAFASWLKEQADVYERVHPRTRLAFVRGELEDPPKQGEAPRCPVAAQALEEGRPVLVYFGREETPDPSRIEKKEIRASRKFERATLDSKKAAEAAEQVEGLLMLRFDLGDERATAYARSLGVEAAPRLVLLRGAGEGPEVLRKSLSGAALAYRLEKLAEPRD